jgi:hypothetical protein
MQLLYISSNCYIGSWLVPAGRSGRVDLIAPGSNALTAIGGFSGATTFGGGHDFGVTSVDFGVGVLFATDRTTVEQRGGDEGPRAGPRDLHERRGDAEAHGREDSEPGAEAEGVRRGAHGPNVAP